MTSAQVLTAFGVFPRSAPAHVVTSIRIETPTLFRFVSFPRTPLCAINAEPIANPSRSSHERPTAGKA
jgi:hypothetical protein